MTPPVRTTSLRLLVGVLAYATALGIAQPLSAHATDADPSGTKIEGRVTVNGLGRAGWVRAEVWPDDEYLNSLPDGARFDKYQLPTAVTDRTGKFSLTVPTDLPAQYVGQDGEIAIELTATDGKTATIAHMSVAVVETATQNVATSQAAVRSADPAAARLVEISELGSRPSLAQVPSPKVTLDVGASQAASKRQAALRRAQSQGLDASDAEGTPVIIPAAQLGLAPASAAGTPTSSAVAYTDPWDCWSETGSRHGPYPERFATFYGKSYAKGRVVHNDGTSHSVGVGVKAPGGTWGQARTDSVKASGVGYDSNYTIADAHVYNKIYQRYYYAKCRSLATGKVETTTTTRPDGFASGPHYTYAGHVNYGSCSRTYANHTYSRTTYTNGVYAGGLDLPFINLSAQSGWTTTTEMHWKFTKAGYLCGQGAQWGQAKRVSAK